MDVHRKDNREHCRWGVGLVILKPADTIIIKLVKNCGVVYTFLSLCLQSGE